MRVMIVDDEPKVRQHLRDLIDRDCDGYEVVAEATDGDEALAAMPLHQPDVVITDIRMPRMDGIRFFAELAQRGYDVGRIILSGYGDFTYAQQAMRQGVQNYLLKPVDVDELRTALARASAELEQSRMVEHQLKSGELARRERWLSNLLHGRNADTAAEEAKALGLRMSGRVYLFLLNNAETEDGEDAREPSEQRATLQTDLCVSTALEQARIAVLCQTDEPRPLAEELLERLTVQPDRAAVVYSEPIDALEQTRSQYLRAKQILDARWLMQGSSILCTSQWPRADYADALAPFSGWEHAALDRAIEQHDDREIARRVDELFALISQAKASPEAVRHFFVEDVLSSVRVIVQNGGDAYEALGERINMEQCLSTMSFDELRGWYARLCLRIADYLRSIRSARPKCVSNRVIELFHRDCAHDYSLQELAGIFYMNGAYLGQLFKKETGTTIHACLTEIRIERAKELLLRTDLPVYEVGETVGYPNLRNFFTAFKKCTGVTPGQYREGSSST